MARRVPSARRGTTSFDPQPGEPWRLPKAPDGYKWHRDTVRAWWSVTASGFATTLLDLDEGLMLRWFKLIDRLNCALDDPLATPASIKSLSAEVRLVEQSLGLSPLARVQMRLAPETPKRPRSASVTSISASELLARGESA